MSLLIKKQISKMIIYNAFNININFGTIAINETFRR